MSITSPGKTGELNRTSYRTMKMKEEFHTENTKYTENHGEILHTREWSFIVLFFSMGYTCIPDFKRPPSGWELHAGTIMGT